MLFRPHLVFLSEPQAFNCDIDNIMTFIKGDYGYRLNSEDIFDPDLPLLKSKASGGTMVLWRRELDPYIDIQAAPSSSILPFIIHPPDLAPTIHVCIYLPTAGQEGRFIEELANLALTLNNLRTSFPGIPIHIRGDFNVSDNNHKRKACFDSFKENEGFDELVLHHPTYHHFTGNGISDSFLDKVLFPKNGSNHEVLSQQLCKHDEPFIDSHHDILLTVWTNPAEALCDEENDVIIAPKIHNSRHRIIWSEEGIIAYQQAILPHLQRLQYAWPAYSSKNGASLFFEATYDVLSTCAKATNTFSPLTCRSPVKNQNVPFRIRKLSNNVLKLWNHLKLLRQRFSSDSASVVKCQEQYKDAKRILRKERRLLNAYNSVRRDQKLLFNPKVTYAEIRRKKRESAFKIKKLKVGSKTYHGSSVPDGFYESVLSLKTIHNNSHPPPKHFDDMVDDYSHIIDLCQTDTIVPPISEVEAMKLLQRMKPNVADFYSITPSHYLNAGPIGWKHFSHMLNILLSEVSITTISEVSRAYAIVLFKGHNKDRTSSRSYRTISTCPVVAKGLDLFLRDHFITSWNNDQSETQFQGIGSSHELAAVLLTECIQFSKKSLKMPTFVLYLDAKSAFDVVRREPLLQKLYYLNGEPDSLLCHINNRISSRQTVLDWASTLMGPMNDELGLEQGGVNSSDFYKIFGKEQLQLSQRSHLGIKMKNVTVSAVGMADDTILISNNIYALYYLLNLTLHFCLKHHVDLSAEKTFLQVYSPPGVDCNLVFNPICINGTTIPVVKEAEHVGVLRSTEGNGPTILARFAAHKRALAGVMQTGLAKSHISNPASALQIERMYAVPVLFSGLASLVLSKKEVDMIDSHYLETLRHLQKLHINTPRCVIYFLAGSLPGSALLHLRQLTLFSMICALPGNILHQVASNFFNAVTYFKGSWFQQIRDVCLMYNLPHPSTLLSADHNRKEFKISAKKNVISFWEHTLRQEALLLKSLTSFKSYFMSLTTPHPLWKTAGHSPYKIAMATIQAKMLSGRYRCGALTRHWGSGHGGGCLISPYCTNILEDLVHILKFCPALNATRLSLYDYTMSFANSLPMKLRNLICKKCDPSTPTFVNFILDCSSDPDVILICQEEGFHILEPLFSVTRTWAFVIHRERLKLLGRWRPGAY